MINPVRCALFTLFVALTFSLNAGTALESGGQFRISSMGPDLDGAFSAFSPAIAYNSQRNEHLVVWAGEDNTGALVSFESEIYARRVDATTGISLDTNRTRVSNMGPDGNTGYVAKNPEVTYNHLADEYLVVWWSENDDQGLTNRKHEIYAQRLDGSDATLIGDRIRVSYTSPAEDKNRQARSPAVAFSADANDYLVVWESDDGSLGLSDQEFEILGQRVDATLGTLSAPVIQISDMGPNGNVSFNAFDANVIYNDAELEFLVVWEGQDNVNGLVNGKDVVFAQRIDAMTGVQVGVNDQQISFNGGNGNADADASNIDVAHDWINNQYLFTWNADFTPGLQVDNDFEVFGRRMDASTGELVGTQIQISAMGPENSSLYWGVNPDVVFNALDEQMLVLWRGESTAAGRVNNEWEIYAEAFDKRNNPIGRWQQLVSRMGPNGDRSFDAGLGAVAYSPVDNHYLAVWDGNHDDASVARDEYEIYGRILAGDAILSGGFEAAP